MKKTLLIAALVLFTCGLSAQGLGTMVFNKTVKSLQFDTIQTEIYGEVVQTIRLSRESHKKLSRNGNVEVKSFYAQLKRVEEKLNESQSKLIGYEWPFRPTAGFSIDDLKKKADMEANGIYQAELDSYRRLYNKELERLKKEDPKKLAEIHDKVIRT